MHWDDSALIEPLACVVHKHGQLAGALTALGLESQGQSTLSTLTDELLSSSAIEGVGLDAGSVRSSLARRLGLEEDGMLNTDHYVEGLVEVMLDAVGNSYDPLSPERMFGWHAALFPWGRSGMYKITAGDWRKGGEPMQVVSGAMGHERVHFQAPPSADVPVEMERLIDWCNNDGHHPVIKAAVAHLWFLTIHPFDDGNGRVARTLTDMMLARMDTSGRYYSMSARIIESKRAYYDMLEATQKGPLDITPWLLWFVGTLEKSIDSALKKVVQTLGKSRYWQHHSDVSVNERQRKMINRLWDGFDGKLTTSKWAKICHCSQDTALRDINDLLSKGLLIQSPGAGRSTGYLLPPRNGDEG